jgi:hypothetical protein
VSVEGFMSKRQTRRRDMKLKRRIRDEIARMSASFAPAARPDPMLSRST